MNRAKAVDDRETETLWQAFVDEDRRLQAPPRVGAAVATAWDAAHGNRRRPGARLVRWALGGTGLAAAAALVAVFVAREKADAPAPPGVLEVDAPPILRLTADRAFETESLQIVRVRIPRAGLQSFGVPLIDPEAPGLVDVDVLVGEDGLPRDIRRIHPVVYVGARDARREPGI